MNVRDLIAQTILNTITERGPEKSTCPSEVARMLFPNNWRANMKAVRDTALSLQQQGKVTITRKGKPINIDSFKGPIRIKIPK